MTRMLHQFASDMNVEPKKIINLIERMNKKGISFSFGMKNLRVTTELNREDERILKKELNSQQKKVVVDTPKKDKVVVKNGRKIRLRKKKKDPKVVKEKEKEKEIVEPKETLEKVNTTVKPTSSNIEEESKEQKELKKKEEEKKREELRQQRLLEEKVMQAELKKVQEELEMKRELQAYKKETDLKKVGKTAYDKFNNFGSNGGGYNKSNNTGGYNKYNNTGGYNKSNNTGGYNKSNTGGYNKSNNTGGYNKSNSGGYNKSNNSGGYNKSNSSGGYNKSNNSGGYNKPNSSGGYNKSNTGGYNKSNTGGYNKPSYNKSNGNDSFEVKKDTQKSKVAKKYVDKFDKNKRKTKNKVYTTAQLQAMGEGYGRRRKKRRVKKEFHKTEITMPSAHKRIIKLSQESISIANLAKEMNIKAAEIIKFLFKEGMMLTMNEYVDIDTATLIASEFKYEIQQVSFDIEDILATELAVNEKDVNKVPRAPIVTVMGHVDHGKTKLLDTIRNANIADGEAGGITQHIGSYHVKTDRGAVTFLDTPGHEAFTAMRARGADVTDVIILIVAADDGIMPQTIEAINHAKAANVPIIVAINKIDKSNIDIPRVKTELMSHDLLSEEFGGDTIVCEISAKHNIGLDELLESVLLQTEMMELTATVDMPARATVIESFIDRGRGVVANILVQEGTLKVGDFIVAGEFFGKVKALFDDKGKKVKSAGPSIPVSVLGLSGVPNAGEPFNATKTEKLSKEIATHFQKTRRDEELRRKATVSSEDLFQQFADDSEMKELRIVVKADVQGSVEAVKNVLLRITNDKVKVKVIHSAVGGILENDVTLAMASNAIVIGFNVKPAAGVKMHADNSGVEMRLYSIIYKMEEEVKRITLGLLDPISREETLGQAEIREVFNITKVGKVAGCIVKSGKIVRNANMRIIRDNIIVTDDKLKSLKRFKDDVKEVKIGYECGISLEKFTDIKPGDILEAYIIIEERVTEL